MNFDDIVLDLKCVEVGIPPLSPSPQDVANIIVCLPSHERKRVSRKIKKLCKKYINTTVLRLKEPFRSVRKSILEKRLSFKSDSQLFNKRILVRRIDFIRMHITREERRKMHAEVK
tara:strand:- start:59 stop:406 length:348 start_codon:yes stop_codon:yes gene_type:complete